MLSETQATALSEHVDVPAAPDEFVGPCVFGLVLGLIVLALATAHWWTRSLEQALG